jgi:hypothetical protein
MLRGNNLDEAMRGIEDCSRSYNVRMSTVQLDPTELELACFNTQRRCLLGAMVRAEAEQGRR